MYYYHRIVYTTGFQVYTLPRYLESLLCPAQVYWWLSNPRDPQVNCWLQVRLTRSNTGNKKGCHRILVTRNSADVEFCYKDPLGRVSEGSKTPTVLSGSAVIVYGSRKSLRIAIGMILPGSCVKCVCRLLRSMV